MITRAREGVKAFWSHILITNVHFLSHDISTHSISPNIQGHSPNDTESQTLYSQEGIERSPFQRPSNNFSLITYSTQMLGQPATAHCGHSYIGIQRNLSIRSFIGYLWDRKVSLIESCPPSRSRCTQS